MPTVINVRDTTKSKGPWHRTYNKDARPVVTFCGLQIADVTAAMTLEEVITPTLCLECAGSRKEGG
jgi:hypothetical protein